MFSIDKPSEPPSRRLLGLASSFPSWKSLRLSECVGGWHLLSSSFSADPFHYGILASGDGHHHDRTGCSIKF